jgi:hypothetical protein
VLANNIGVKNPKQYKNSNDLMIAIRLQQRINTTVWGKAYTGLKSISSTMLGTYKWAMGDWTPRRLLNEKTTEDLVRLARDNYGIKGTENMSKWVLMKAIQKKQRWESSIAGRTWNGLKSIGKGISSIWKFFRGSATPSSILKTKDRIDLEKLAKRYGIDSKQYKTNYSLMKAIQKAERKESSLLGKVKSIGSGIKSSYKAAKGIGGFLKKGIGKGIGTLGAGIGWANRKRYDLDDLGSSGIPEQKRGFATGGIVGGILGKATKIVAHGGERVMTMAQQAASKGMGTGDIATKTYKKLSELVLIQKGERHDNIINRRHEKGVWKQERWYRKWKKEREGKGIFGSILSLGMAGLGAMLSALATVVVPLILAAAGGAIVAGEKTTFDATPSLTISIFQVESIFSNSSTKLNNFLFKSEIISSSFSFESG